MIEMACRVRGSYNERCPLSQRRWQGMMSDHHGVHTSLSNEVKICCAGCVRSSFIVLLDAMKTDCGLSHQRKIAVSRISAPCLLSKKRSHFAAVHSGARSSRIYLILVEAQSRFS